MSRDDVETAIRAAIHDSYRYGLGFAIEAIETFKLRSTDGETFEDLLTHLRDYSVNLWSASK